MNSKLTKSEREYLGMIKTLHCVVCDQAGPSDAHHIKQGQTYTCIPLCKDCHQGSHNGIHGRQHMWKVKKMDELLALNNTIASLMSVFLKY